MMKFSLKETQVQAKSKTAHQLVAGLNADSIVTMKIDIEIPSGTDLSKSAALSMLKSGLEQAVMAGLRAEGLVPEPDPNEELYRRW